MTPKIVSIKIDLEKYTNTFRTRTSADIISLSIVKEAIENGYYVNFNNHTSSGITYQKIVPTLNQDLIDYEITKTFISLMRNVNDYIDRMIAVLDCSKNNYRVNKDMKHDEAVKEIESLIENRMIENCSKTNEEFKVKLKKFPHLTTEFIKYLTTYNLLRNCYEHKKTISKKGIQIPIKKLGIYDESGNKVLLGQPIQGGSTILIKFDQKIIPIKSGQPAKLDYDDIISTELYLSIEVSNQISKSVASEIKTRLK